jgi:predicted CXXCH cytochrome family protein
MKNIFPRLLVVLFFAIPIAGLALFFFTIDGDAASLSQQGQPECTSCHAEIQSQWQMGMHANAITDDVFVTAWTEQGKPSACLACHTTGFDAATGTWQADGVTCLACHSPAGDNHPTDNMSVDKTTDLCGGCHSDPRFGDQWKMSAHYQRDIACSTCHDPHSTGFKTLPGVEAAGQDPSYLCANCHKDYAGSSVHSNHGKSGVTCVNCHLGLSEDEQGETHQMTNHSFSPTLETCNTCHSKEMHAGAGSSDSEVTSEQPVSEVLEAGVSSSSEPAPVSPLGFAAVAILAGLALGVVLAPLLERLYRFWNKGEK